MKTALISLAALLSAQCLTAAEPQNGTGETDGYRLVWQDLFDDGVLRPERWNIEVNGNGGGNHELQYYHPDNVRVGDDGYGNGCLILTARRLEEPIEKRHFTSGRVNTSKLFAFCHGKIEAAIRFPKTANGLWPAFWMMGNDHAENGWPKCGETDIVEMGHSTGIKSATTDRFFNGALHWGQAWPNRSYARDTTKSYSLQDGEFHLFTLIWDEDYVSMYVDLDKTPRQTPYFRMKITADDPDNPDSAGNYFHKENFILFNLAVGGDFPDCHFNADITALNAENGYEASMYVNYVKVYQKGTPDESLSAVVPGDGIEAGTADAIAETACPISFDGVTVSAPGADISVVTPQGTTVAEGRASVPLTGQRPGLYIVRACRTGKTNTAKIIK